MGVRHQSISLLIRILYTRFIDPTHFSFLRFADSDALWAGLVRGIFIKVEERVAAGQHPNKVKAQGHAGRDFKREWRVKRAKQQLVEHFGLPLIRRAIAYAVVFLFALVALVIVETTGKTRVILDIHASAISYFETVLVAVAGLVGSVAAILPSFKLAFASSKESNLNRGVDIFMKASKIKDKLGFLAQVKLELQELFNYLRKFEKQVGTQIIIVPIIDDLDRCITDGRNVKVLEAMQLILSVPGAPILSFLAVDSRIVVASIEDHYSRVFEKTNISGHEYLDKIVQIPFAMPEPPPEKVERLISKSLEGEAASPAIVAQLLKVFGTHGRQTLTRVRNVSVSFKVAPTKAQPEGAVVDLERLVQAAEAVDEFQGRGAETTLQLVCDAARVLGPYLEKLADRLILMDEKNVLKEEAVEVLCRATNAALEAGKMDFKEANAMRALYEFSVAAYDTRMYTVHTQRRCKRASSERWSQLDQHLCMVRMLLPRHGRITCKYW